MLKKELDSHAETMCKLESARKTITRKTELIKQLRQEAAARIDGTNQGHSQEELERQIRELQATMARKDENLRQVSNICATLIYLKVIFSFAKNHLFFQASATCLQMRASRDAWKHSESQLKQVHEAHETVVGKLRLDLKRKQGLLSASKAEAERLRAGMQTLKEDQLQACARESDRCQSATAVQTNAQEISQGLFCTVVDLCRLLLQCLFYMQLGECFSSRLLLALLPQGGSIFVACRQHMHLEGFCFCTKCVYEY